MDKENYNKRLWQEMKIIGDKYEQLATEYLLNWFQQVQNKVYNVSYEAPKEIKFSGYDIQIINKDDETDVLNIEIKTDIMSKTTKNFFIECFNKNEDPSGLLLTESNYYIITDTNKYYLILTNDLIKLVKNKNKKYKKLPSRNKYNKNITGYGFIIPMNDIINLPNTIMIY